MFAYYSERAAEFDEVYLGRGAASLSDPTAYREETAILGEFVRRRCSGRLIDVACGTAFWLPFYAGNCEHITLLDQSQPMLKQAEERVASLAVADRTTILRRDVFAHDYGEAQFDTALVAFLLSHFTKTEENRFFEMLIPAMKMTGRILILDSVWSSARAETQRKESWQTRNLTHSRRGFKVYKRYFDKSDLSLLAEDQGLRLEIEHFGKVFFAAGAGLGSGQ